MTQAPVPDRARTGEQRAWYFYDWANSAYVTTTSTVLIGPYLISVAEQAACPGLAEGASCGNDLTVLGLPVAPGSLVGYTVAFSTIVSALALPVVGAIADRSHRKKNLMAGFAWVGAAAAASLYFVTGDNWQLGAFLLIVANICLGSSLVVYDAILCEIAAPDERDRVSSRGWALGYLGGFLLLAANLGLVLAHESLGLSQGMAVRISLLSAGVWWAVFTVIPFLGLRNRPPRALAPVGDEQAPLIRQAFGQLADTLRHLRGYRDTWMFLLAYLLFNDGIQTVVTSSSIYGTEELGFDSAQLIQVILLVQLVGFGGALLFGRAAGRWGAKRSVLVGIALWLVIVVAAFLLPSGQFAPFVALAVLIGIVLGGTQALSRSLFSQLIPAGREAEYFSLYQATERGTSWFGAFLFALIFQLTDSYRPAIISLIVFFLLGGLLLTRVNVRRGIAAAGNREPAVI